MMDLTIALGSLILIFSISFCLAEILVGLLCGEYKIGIGKEFYFNFFDRKSKWSFSVYEWMIQFGWFYLIKWKKDQ